MNYTTYQIPSLNAGAHPIVKRLHAEMLRTKTSMVTLAEKSGVAKGTIRLWFQNKSTINLHSLGFCLAVFDLTIIATLPRGVKKGWKNDKSD